MEKNKILVPVDFQSQSVFALEYAAKVAKSINAKISCLYVIEEPGYITGLHISKEIQDKIRREAEIKLAEITNKVLKNISLPYEIIVTRGKVYKRIVETAKDLNARFIMMGKSNSSDFKKNLTGTNTKHIIVNSNVPVITVRNNKHLSDDHLVLPLDLTKPVLAKIEMAIEIAAMLNTRVTLLTICREDWVSIRIKLEKKLSEIKRIFENQNLVCSTKLIETKKPVAFAINKYAKESNAELIFLMTQQEIDFMDYFIGLTAQEIINKSEIPVLSVIPNIKRNKTFLDELAVKHLVDPVSIFG